MPYQYQYNYPNIQPNFQQNPMIFQQSQPQSQFQPQIQNSGILFVEGDRGAEEFQMLPNTFAFLKSTDGKAVYFKQALANGGTTCEKFVLGKMSAPTQADYVTREEFDELVRLVTAPKGEHGNE